MELYRCSFLESVTGRPLESDVDVSLDGVHPHIQRDVANRMAGCVVEIDVPQIPYDTHEFQTLYNSKFIFLSSGVGVPVDLHHKRRVLHADSHPGVLHSLTMFETSDGHWIPHQYFQQVLHRNATTSLPKTRIVRMINEFLPHVSHETIRRSIKRIGKCPLKKSFPNCDNGFCGKVHCIVMHKPLV